MTIYLDPKYRKSSEKAKEIAQKLTYIIVDDLIESVNVDLKKDAIELVFDSLKLESLGVSIEEVEKVLPKFEKVEGSYLIKLSEAKNLDPEKFLEQITNIKVRGIPEIKRVLTILKGNEWIIRTDGSNLSEVLAIEGVDPLRTTTNDIHEIAEILGIEAARNAIIRESQSVLNEQGLDVDIRHIMLVADIMTNSGEVQQIGRHGVSGEKSSVLARAAFELTIQHLVNAAIKGEKDPLKGVVENIIVGQSMPLGTGSVELFMNMGVKKDE